MSAAFVVQKHAATSLHYDFRLEVDGVMRSWAVPKGPSTNPAERRLAMEVEDHPMSWNDFEGRIRAGYGKGAVIVWDAGTYENRSDADMAAALEAGHARFWLEGEKLRGGWSLRRVAEGDKPRWLLIKSRDEHADRARDITAERPESVRTGRAIEDV